MSIRTSKSRRSDHWPRRRRAGGQRRARGKGASTISKFTYLGSPHRTYHWVFITRREAGLKTIETLELDTGFRVGAQAVGHQIISAAGFFPI